MKISEQIFNQVFNTDFKNKLITGLIDNYNIPILTDKTETKVYSAIYEVFVDIAEEILVAKRWTFGLVPSRM